MKRAAGQIRKVRRNSNKDKDLNDDGPPEQVQQPVRRKPTPEEAALTAKNYRLAKELSDLRVRHREECKAVTRLTMENMNLASRWREAIGHVAMLKKELALHQRRAAEALALQKAQAELQRVAQPSSEPTHYTPSKNPTASLVVDQSPDNNNGTSLHDVAAEMDRMDRILAAHQAQSDASQVPPPPTKEATTPPTLSTSSYRSKNTPDSLSFTDDVEGEEKKAQFMDQAVTPSPQKDGDEEEEAEEVGVDYFESQSHKGRPQKDFFSLFPEGTEIGLDVMEVGDPPLELSPPSVTPSEPPPPSPPQQDDSPSFEENQNDDTLQELEEADLPLFPMTASPKLMVKPKVMYNEEFPADITSDVTKHPRSAERRTSSEFNDIAEEESTATANVTTRNRPPPPPLSGIDAFEASFATQFPDSFSPTEDNKSPSPQNNTEEYNPFFPSPSKEIDGNNDASPSNVKPSSSADFDSDSIESSNQGTNRRGQADNSPSPVLSGKPRSSSASASDSFFASSPSNSENSSTGVKRNLKNGISSSTNGSSPGSGGALPKRYSGYPNNANAHDHGAESPPQSNALGSRAVRYETPPHGQRSPEVPYDSEEPKRPEKAGAAAARARYEKALQPRGFAGNSRLFPRRAEREEGGGASPVSVPSVSSANNDEGHTDSRDLQVNRSKLAMAKARVKERTAAFTGRAAVSGNDNTTNKSYTTFRGNQWTPRPSPTDSVGSKPWDEEETGDIPLRSIEPATLNVSDGSNVICLTSGNNLNFTNSNSSPLSTSSRSLRSSITRDRPWDRSNNQQQEPPSRTSHTAAIRAANYLVQQEDTNNNDSPTSRFIAAGKSRRRVKQPISYAEPSLSSKLRRGDVFFPKSDQDETNEMRSHSSSAVHL